VPVVRPAGDRGGGRFRRERRRVLARHLSREAQAPPPAIGVKPGSRNVRGRGITWGLFLVRELFVDGPNFFLGPTTDLRCSAAAHDWSSATRVGEDGGGGRNCRRVVGDEDETAQGRRNPPGSRNRYAVFPLRSLVLMLRCFLRLSNLSLGSRVARTRRSG
jgi:hypothetical protein